MNIPSINHGMNSVPPPHMEGGRELGIDREGLVALLNMPAQRLPVPAGSLVFSEIREDVGEQILSGLERVSLSRLPLGALGLFWADVMVPLLVGQHDSFWITNYDAVQEGDDGVFVLYGDRAGMWVSRYQEEAGDTISQRHSYAILPDGETLHLKWNGEPCDRSRLVDLIGRLGGVVANVRQEKHRMLVARVSGMQPQATPTPRMTPSAIDALLRHSVKIETALGLSQIHVDTLSQLFKAHQAVAFDRFQGTSRQRSALCAQLETMQTGFLEMCGRLCQPGVRIIDEVQGIHALIVYLKYLDAGQEIVALLSDGLERLSIPRVPVVVMAPIRASEAEMLAHEAVLGKWPPKFESSIATWKTNPKPDPRDWFLSSGFYGLYLRDEEGGSHRVNYSGFMLTAEDNRELNIQTYEDLKDAVSFDGSRMLWQSVRFLDSDHMEPKRRIIKRLEKYVAFLNGCHGTLEILKDLVVEKDSDCFQIQKGYDTKHRGIRTVVGTEYLYRSHYSYRGNLWHMDGADNSSQKGNKDLVEWVDLIWEHGPRFMAEILSDPERRCQVRFLVDRTEVFSRLSTDDRLDVAYQGKQLCLVVGAYQAQCRGEMKPYHKTIRRTSRLQVLGGTPQGKTLFGPMVDTLNKGLQGLEKSMKTALSEQDTDLWTEAEKRAQTRESSPTDSSSSEENANEPVELQKARYKASTKFEKAGRLLVEAKLEATAMQLEATATELEATETKLEATEIKLEATATELEAKEARIRELEELMSRSGILPQKAPRGDTR